MRLIRIAATVFFCIFTLVLNGCATPNKLSIYESSAQGSITEQQMPTPSEDTTPLVEVRWQDRSTDTLMVFAGNGKWLAISELCYRYTKEKNIEQATIWCDKAGTKDVKIYDYDPSPVPKHEFLYRIETGALSENFFRFDPSKMRRVKVKLSNSRSDQHWGALLSLCLDGPASIDTACLSVTSYGDNNDKLIFKTYRYKVNKKYAIQEMPTTHKMGDAIELAIYLDDKKLHFIINGKDDMAQDIAFPVEALSLYCTTADCAYEFFHAPKL
ncbi:hypothetical protein [Duganella aceris]|uniref:SPRY domain-containing protein n=1 Tax=Duganella aceris TaxID=2703883 RepID=A0ABX0FJU6_9BURK|nr:hypothetical protein [Duganella aceris]NGZ84843.1 hypothetical protein [Duganella aceris]